MSSDVGYTPGTQDISSPRFAAFYNWMMGRPLVRRMFDPLRRETVGQARGIVLEVGAGGGQNFPFYDPARVVRVEAVEPDKAMLMEARRARQLPFPSRSPVSRSSPSHSPMRSSRVPWPPSFSVPCRIRSVVCARSGGCSSQGVPCCSSNMCARKEASPPGYRMRSCHSRSAAWAIAIGTAIPCAPFCKPVSRPPRSAISAGDSSLCCSYMRDVPTQEEMKACKD